MIERYKTQIFMLFLFTTQAETIIRVISNLYTLKKKLIKSFKNYLFLSFCFSKKVIFYKSYYNYLKLIN